MADTKISGMAAATALTGAEVLPVVQSSANVKATTQQVVDAAMTTGLTRQALGSINTNTTIDWSVGSYVTATIAGALAFTFSNPAPTGKACVAYLQLTNGGSAAITWPVSVAWSGGTAPTLRASGVDLLRFYTQDGGTTWFGTSENDEPDTTGLTEPLTVTRATRQSSALSAASAGETKFQFRDIVRAGLLAVRADVDANELLMLPDCTNPGLTGWFQTGSTTFSPKGIPASATVTSLGTATASNILNSIGATNQATAASANAQAGRYADSGHLRDGSSNGDGCISWGIFAVPDVSYGSGATGVKIDVGLAASGAIAANGNRASGRSVLLEYNTNQSDTNWQLCVYNTGMTTADTGLAFSAGKTYFWMIHMPRGGSSCYAYIKEIGGSAGSATVAAMPGSTAMYGFHILTTLDAVARNIRVAMQWDYIPLEF